MASERWHRARELFEGALDQPIDARDAYLAEQCGEDAELADAVRSLLEADADAETFLDAPLAQPPRSSAAPSPQLGPPPARDAPSDGAPRVGPYRLLRRIGQGGMGTVHLAVRDDDAFQRRVVIKLVRQGAESPGLRRRLRTERQILASLDHPHIASLFDGGTTDDGQPYFVMEYIDGVPIDAYCDQNRLTLEQRIDLFVKVCSAVHYAHQNLVVHRDLKPSNILVGADGEPKLLDFGIAKLLNPDLAAPELEPTATWLRVLTPQYASPEQVRGKLVTTISDVYSLGVLLYELLTGRLPHQFAGRTAQEIERLLTEDEPDRPSTAVTAERAPDNDDEPTAEAVSRDRAEQPGDLRRKLAGDLDAIVLKALRSAPQQRYGSVERLANDLERFQEGLPVTARRGTWRYRAGKYVRRNRLAVAVAAAAVAALIGFGLAMAQQSARVLRERDQAQQARKEAEAVLDLMSDVFRVADPYSDAGQRLTVREALLDARPVLDRRLRDQPLVRADVLASTGKIFFNLGLWDEAEDQLREALEIRGGLLGEHHHETARAMQALAQVHTEQGRYDEAESLSQTALSIVEPDLGRRHPDMVPFLNTLVSVYCYRRDLDRAEPLAIEVLGIARDHPETAPNEVVNALAHLASTRYALGDAAEAAKLYEEALAVQRITYGDRHPELAPMLVNRAVALRQLGQLNEAEGAFLDVLAIRREHLGESHPSIAITLNHVAKLQGNAGRWDEAEASFREAYRILRTAADQDHPRAIFLELRIIESILAQGRTEDTLTELRTLTARWPETASQLPSLRPYADWLRALAVRRQGGGSAAEATLQTSFDQLLEHDRNLAADILAIATSTATPKTAAPLFESLARQMAASSS